MKGRALCAALLGAILSACGNVSSTSVQPDMNVVATSIVQTLVESHFERQTATALALPTPVPASSTPLPTLPIPATDTATSTFVYYFPTLGSPTATLTPGITGTVFTPTVDPGSLAYGCNNLAFVRDVTIPAGTVLKPGEDFTKTWKVANTGTCNWMYQYAIVLLGGEAFSGKTTKLNRVVSPGHWAELSVQMGAPRAAGSYRAWWRMSDGAGHMFGASLALAFIVRNNPDTPTPPADTVTPTDTATPTQTP